MSEYAPTRRVILDAPPDDYERCIGYAREALRKRDEGDIWDVWNAGEPDFQAVIRVNKASVSVKAVRRVPA